MTESEYRLPARTLRHSASGTGILAGLKVLTYRTIGTFTLLVSGLAPLTAPAQELPVAELQVGTQSVQAELAATSEARQQGLMYRTQLGEDSGMLFVYPTAEPRCFWMRNTLIPLSLAYTDADGTITQVLDLRPLDETPRCSDAPARYALEMNQGWFGEHGIGPGDRITGLPD